MTYTLDINEEELTEMVKEGLVKQIVGGDFNRFDYRGEMRIADHEIKRITEKYFSKWLSDNREKVDSIIERVVEKHIEESAKSHCGIIGKRLQK